MPGLGPNTFASFLASWWRVRSRAPLPGNAVTETTQVLADGNRIVNRTTAAVYRDGEGRERREQSIPNIGPFTAQGAPPSTIFLSDPVAGVHYSLNPNEKTAIKLQVPQASPFPPMPPGGRGEFNVMAARARRRNDRGCIDGASYGGATGHDL
jgi:hypothetical protein